MSFDIKGPEFPEGCAIVFGASGGIGQAIAGLLLERGANLVLTYHSRLENLTRTLEGIYDVERVCRIVRCDVTDKNSVDDVFRQAIADYKRIHTIIVATGRLFDIGPVTDFRVDALKDVLETDVVGLFNIAQAGVPHLRESSGSITALVTPAIHRTIPTDALSSTPKTAVAMLIRHIAAEEGPNGVRANAVGPGVIDAGMNVYLKQGVTKELYDTATNWTPLRREGRAEEVAQVVCFLASARASFVSGQVVHCDGGLSVA